MPEQPLGMPLSDDRCVPASGYGEQQFFDGRFSAPAIRRSWHRATSGLRGVLTLGCDPEQTLDRAGLDLGAGQLVSAMVSQL